MTTTLVTWLLIVLALVAANLPWLSERIFLVIVPKGRKRAAWRWAEWSVLYLLVGLIAAGLEVKVTGERYGQDWEFFAITLSLFLVFALPGFIYRHDLKNHLARRAS